MANRPVNRSDKTLTFASEYKMPVRLGSKTATVRYNDEKDLSVGDKIKFKEPNGLPFYRAKITHSELAEVRNTPELIQRIGKRHGATDWKELRNNLNRFYEDSIHATTMVKVVAWDHAEG